MPHRKNRRSRRKNRQTKHPSPRGEGLYARYEYRPGVRRRSESAGRPELTQDRDGRQP